MKYTNFTRIILVAVFGLAVAFIASCGGSSAVQPTSEYPPLKASIAQADVENLDGSTFKVADKKGKVLLLNMWATWCGPCREEMPELVKLQDKYRDQGFEIIGLNTNDGDTVDMIKDFAKDQGLNYTLTLAPTAMQVEIVKLTSNEGIPQSLLIDRDGSLRGVFLGGSETEIEKMKTTVAKVISGQNN